MNCDEYILSIPKFAKKIGTDNLKVLMNKLGNPHLKIKTVHVAGTNGKGSVTEMMRSILTEAGYKTGVFTSPHLVKLNERIRIDNEMISDEDFERCFLKVYDMSLEMENEGYGHPSFFEFVFAMAAVYFQENAVDIAIFETGMGGRLDATNVINPLVSVITSIGLDHMIYLGDTIEKIAYEKAGIIKDCVPVIYNTGEKEADLVIEETAMAKNSPCFGVEKNKILLNSNANNYIDFSIESSYYKYYNLKLKTGALYQMDNANTAIMALYTILISDYKCDGLYKEDVAENFEEYVRKGLYRFNWPGRMEFIKDNVLIDGAHNEDAIVRFTETVSVIESKYKGIKLLFAVSSDKDYENIIRHISREIRIDELFIAEINSDRLTDRELVKDTFCRYLPEEIMIHTEKSSVTEAYHEALKDLRDDELLICVGSLYLVGEIKND